MAVIALLAALATPVLRNFKPNIAASATRQLMDDIGRARQLAISQRTTVYMVFVPTNFWSDPAITGTWTAADWTKATNLFDKQLIGYNYVTLRSVGDQPGRGTTNYLGSWRTLPDGAFIPWPKFGKYNPTVPVMNLYSNGPGPLLAMQVYGFQQTTKVPFPGPDTPRGTRPKAPFASLPYIAFDFLGRLVDDNQIPLGQNVLVPLARGSVGFSRDANTKIALQVPPSLTETPLGNSTNSYTAINIDWLTGRARVEQAEIQ
jgi:hypothetical protein